MLTMMSLEHVLLLERNSPLKTFIIPKQSSLSYTGTLSFLH